MNQLSIDGLGLTGRRGLPNKPDNLLNKIVVGIDEVGRGPLAGPVVAAAVILPDDFDSELIIDSKKLTEKKLKVAYDLILKHVIRYSVQAGSAKLINEVGVDKATEITIHKCLDEIGGTNFDHILFDGLGWCGYNGRETTMVPQGDNKFLCIAAASIIAKVRRDEYMRKLHLQFPYYGWDSNKGYHSAVHAAGLKSHGPTQYHRINYIKKFLVKN